MINETNFIHPTAIVEEGVYLGNNNYIGPFCYLKKGVFIGDNNRFEAYCSIGTEAEHKDFFNSPDPENGVFTVIIGDNNVFREYVTVNRGTQQLTFIGSNVIMLRNSHVGHDSTIEDNVTLSCNVLIGGHSIIMKGANMGLGSICHQFSTIGPYSIIGMGGIVTKKSEIFPAKKYVGNPVKCIGDNTIALERNNISEKDLNNLIDEYNLLKHGIPIKKKITIIIPCFGRPERTKRIINNVLNQDIDNWEAFIIGDGCPHFQKMIDDGSVDKFISQAERKGSKLVMFNLDKNYGGFGYKVLDYAFEHATGEYIIFAGNDDILKPNHFSHYLSEIENYDMVAYPTFVGPTNSIRYPELAISCIGHSEIIVKREIVESYRHSNVYGHDWGFISYIMSKTKNIKISNNDDYTYIVTHIPNRTIDEID